MCNFEISEKGIQPKHAARLRIQLAVLNNAKSAADVALASWRLHALTGKLIGHFSIAVDKNWGLTFNFNSGDVELLVYQDYH
jgi:toxin HigB-1